MRPTGARLGSIVIVHDFVIHEDSFNAKVTCMAICHAFDGQETIVALLERSERDVLSRAKPLVVAHGKHIRWTYTELKSRSERLRVWWLKLAVSRPCEEHSIASRRWAPNSAAIKCDELCNLCHRKLTQV